MKKKSDAPEPEILVEYDVLIEALYSGNFKVTCPICTAGILRWSELGAQNAMVEHLDFEHAISAREDS